MIDASGSGCTSAAEEVPVSGTAGTTVPSVAAGGCSEEDAGGCSVVGGVVTAGSLLAAGGVEVAGGAVAPGVEEAGGAVDSGADELGVWLLDGVPFTGLPV